MRKLLVAVVGLALLAAGCADSASSAISTGHGPRVVGYQWRLVRLTDSHGTLRLAPSSHAVLDFAGDGAFYANDTANFYSGHYRLTGFGYRLGANLAGTAAGEAGSAGSRAGRTISAMGTLLRTRHTVALHPDGRSLVVTTPGRTLIFRRAGAVPAQLTAPASPTPTATRGGG